jgi:hypothetical protein
MNDNDFDLDDIPESPFSKEPPKKKRKNSKAKGNRWENQLCKELTARCHDEFRRVPQSGGFMGGRNRTRNILMREDAKEILAGDLITPAWFPFTIEAKNYSDSPKMHNLLSIGDKDLDGWLKQAKGDAEFAKKEWLLIFNITRKKAFVCMSRKLFEEKVDILEYPSNYTIYKSSHIIVDKDIFFRDYIEKFFPTDWRTRIRDIK